ncbi:MAG: glycosyltransferase family 4 protein [Candidatus Bathyarchaeia archaeon]
MKVLMVTPHIFAGGAEKVVLHSAQELKAMGCDVAVAALSVNLNGLPQKLKNLRFLQPGKPLPEPTITGSRTAVESMSRECYTLFRLVRRHAREFDVLNVFNFPSYWATFLAQTKKPVVWTCSEVLGPYRQTKELYEKSLFFRMMLNFALPMDKLIVKRGVNAIVTYSKLNARLIEERYGRTSRVIPPCVDYDFFSEAIPNAKQKLGFENTTLLLHVGWLVPSKNHSISIKALSMLKKRVPNAKLAIVGTGALEQSLKREAEQLGLGDDVVFTDADSQENLRLLYQACDLNLYPVSNQTFGLVPFEVLAAGKPSIVSSDCGAADVIARENIGFLINPTADTLAEKILFALNHPSVLEDMVKRGQRFVQESLTWRKYARDMYDIFAGVLRSENT